VLAALLHVGGGAAAHSTTAAALWGFPAHSLRPIHIGVALGSGTPRTDLATVHVVRWLPDHHVAMLDGVRITTPDRTLCDLAAVLPVRRLERNLDWARSRRLVTGLRLQRTIAELESRATGRAGGDAFCRAVRRCQGMSAKARSRSSSCSCRCTAWEPVAGLPDSVRLTRWMECVSSWRS
jgi:hypothetical protein